LRARAARRADSHVLTATILAHPFQVEDMQNLFRVGEVRISPDGQWAVFT